MTIQRLTTTVPLTTEPQTTAEPLTTQTTTEPQTTEQTIEPASTELQISTEPLSSPGSEPLSTTEQPTITELLIPTEPPTTMNEPTTTTESLGKEGANHFTSIDKTETGVVPSDKENDIDSTVNTDPKFNLAITLLATNLAMFILLAMVVFVLVLVLLCGHKGKAKEAKSAKVEHTKIKELETKDISPMHTFNAYESPVHSHYCSEEKVDIM